MSAHKSIDKICIIVVVLALVSAVLFCNGKLFGIEAAAHTIGYENRLFDNSKVHTFDIVIDDWDAFLETCESEVYTNCNVIIDGEAVKNVGIRGKGNTSLSSVKNSGSSRYSFKIEFDQYDNTKSYHGLDKLCLNNIIQDTTYMKDYSEFINSVDLAKMIDDAAAMIDSYVQKDPTKFCTYEDFQKGVAAMKSFCTLRAESVRGQLDGTIPSTSEGQQADSSALIDTGDLVISDMGSMGGGNGGFGRSGDSTDRQSGGRESSRDRSGGSRPSRSGSDTATESSAVSKTSVVADMSQSFDGGSFGGFGGNMPEGFDPSQMPSGGSMPEGFDPSQAFGGNMPEGMTPPGRSSVTSESSGTTEQTGETKPADQPAETTSSEQSDQPAETTASEKPAEMPANTEKQDSGRPSISNFPSMSGGSGSDNTEMIVLFVASGLCLVVGLIIAAVYKR